MWKSVADFIAMGGKGPFVWGTYIVALILLFVEVVALRRWQRRIRDRILCGQEMHGDKER